MASASACRAARSDRRAPGSRPAPARSASVPRGRGASRNATGTSPRARSATSASRRSSSALSITTVTPEETHSSRSARGLTAAVTIDVCGRHVAREHLKQLPLAGDVDSQARAPGLVDERQRLVGLAGEEDLQIDAGDGGRVPELPGVAGERRRIQHVERRSVALDPLRKLLGASAELDLPGLEAGRQRDDAFTARSHPGGGIGGLEVHAHAGARSRGPRRALSRYSSRQRCTIRRAQRSA